MNSNRWKFFLILILAVILFHILIIKIFVIGSSSDSSSAQITKDVPPVSEPPMPKPKRR